MENLEKISPKIFKINEIGNSDRFSNRALVDVVNFFCPSLPRDKLDVVCYWDDSKKASKSNSEQYPRNYRTCYFLEWELGNSIA